MIEKTIENQTQWNNYITNLTKDEEDFYVIPKTHQITITASISSSSSLSIVNNKKIKTMEL